MATLMRGALPTTETSRRTSSGRRWSDKSRLNAQPMPSQARAPPLRSIPKAKAWPNAWPRSMGSRPSAWRRNNRPRGAVNVTMGSRILEPGAYVRCQRFTCRVEHSSKQGIKRRGAPQGRSAMAVTPSGRERTAIAAEAFLRALADHGVDYFFANPGTDFPPIVEAFNRAKKTNAKVPKPILIPHENLAVGMAHGAYLMTGRPQAVMVHVNVGTANTINNLTNLSRDRVPLILAAGRTPITEKGSFGSRSRPIHWAQEMFDQAGMVRELVKWDYELRQPNQIGDVVARATEVAMAHPRGPVYLVLPREPLSAPLSEPITPIKPRAQAAPVHPDPKAIATLAEWIASAERPLIIAATLASDAVPALAHLAERCAIPVVTHNPRTLCLPSSHSMHFGFEPGALLADADLVISLESDVPWIPHLQNPPAGCRVAHVGEDPFYVRYPMRSFPSDLAVQAGAR